MSRVPVPVAAFSFAIVAAAFGIAAQRAEDTVRIQLLAFNDLHGHLEPPSGSNGRIGNIQAGGAEYLATHLSAYRARHANTITVSAGDLIGASPLLSGMFRDEPTIRAANAMRIDVSSVGNHEFDNGWRELLRMQQGGCHPELGCAPDTDFPGAAFQYLAANVVFDPKTTGRSGPVLPPFTVKEIGGVRIGFIGLTLRGTPQLVMPEGVAGLRFEPEAETANRYARILRSQNIRSIVVLVHEGGEAAQDDPNGCAGMTGPIVRIADRMSDEIDVVVSGHTHRAYNCSIDSKLVTSAASFGRLVTVIDLTISTRTSDIVAKSARNVPVTRDVPKDPAQTAVIEHYRPHYAAVANRAVGTIASDLTRAPNSAGESVLGNIVADATLDGAAAAGQNADVAFMNPGGIRADLLVADERAPRTVTFAEASSVLPFRNRVVVQTMTGRMLKEVLEEQFENVAHGEDEMLSISRGFTYAYDRSAARSRRVDAQSMTLHGRPIAPDREYRVALNEFIAAGGDNFTVFTRGTAVATVGLDLDMLIAYLKNHSPVRPVPTDRVRRIE